MQNLDAGVDECFILCLAVGQDGKIYSGCTNSTIRVWSGTDGALLQELEAITELVSALVVGLDGKIYSASSDARTPSPIQVWSGVDGALLQTFDEIYSASVYGLAVGLDGSIFSGSHDGHIRVWSGVNGALLKTFETQGRSPEFWALAVGPDNTIFLGSPLDDTIQVRSSVDGKLLHTLRVRDSLSFCTRFCVCKHRTTLRPLFFDIM